MKDIFKPMAHILALKCQDMVAASLASQKLQNWLNGKQEDNKDDEEDAKQGDKLEIDFETKYYKMRSFEGHEQQRAMQLAADYSDQWFSSSGASFNCYYICTAGGGVWPCCTLIESMAWDRLHDDPAHTGQRWYCKKCRAKYKTKYGLLCEIIVDKKGFYCKAELPPMAMLDAKFMKIQEDYHQYDTPEALLAALPKVKPLAVDRLFMKTGIDGHYSFDKGLLDELETLNWMQLFNLRKQ
jgi:hypothetical protein